MYTFIVNPNSRSGRGRFLWNKIEAELKQRRVEYRALLTRYQKHAILLAKEITGDLKCHTIVVLGGDGTVNEVVNGIVDLKKVTLGYIPTGSSNDFARGLSLPSDPKKALDCVLKSATVRSIDIGLLSYRDKSKLFAVSTGIGFDAEVCHQAVVSKLKLVLNKLHIGKLTYAGIALHRLYYDRPVQLTLSLDGEEPKVFDKTYFAAVMNLPYEGGGFWFCPKAKADDGELDVIVVSGIPKLKVLAFLPTAFGGHHTRFKGIYIYRCKSVMLEAERALAVHTDGEPLFLQKKITVTTAPCRLNVILPG